MPKRYFAGEVNYSFPVAVVNPGSEVSNALSVSVGRAAPQFARAGIVNAASFVGGPIAPGEMVTIFGSNFSNAERVRVLFNDMSGTIIDAQATQLSSTVPYSLTGFTAVAVVIEAEGVRSVAVSLPVADAAPALFTANSSGRGYAAALNQDGAISSENNPAARGSIVVLYGTGGGALDGGSRLVLPVTVLIDGIETEVLYAGAAPGLVSGAVQLNVRVPENATEGRVVWRVGDAESQTDVRVALR